MADIDLADTQMPGEGRLDGLLVDDGLLRTDLGLGAVERGGVGIDHGLAYGLRLDLFQVALISDVGEFGGGVERMQFGDVVIGA